MKYILFISILFFTSQSFGQKINGQRLFGDSGTIKNASAQVEIFSTTRGFLIPRHSTSSFAGISSKAKGLMAYDTTLNRPTWYDGTAVRVCMSDGLTTNTYAATTNIDFSNTRMQTLSLTGDVIFTTANLRSGSEVVIRVISDATIRNFTFPGGWTFMTSAAPTSIAASKTGMLTLRSFGTTDANIIATWVVQP